MEHTKVQNEIIKDGKVYKHFDTRQSQVGTPGYLTDVYKSEDGSFQYVERLTNAIRFSKHSRITSEGNMISPADFLQYLDKTGMISELDCVVLEKEGETNQ